MEMIIDILIALALLSVVGALFMGVYAMLRGGEYGRANSNRFMWWRVRLQAFAVIMIMIGFAYKMSHHG